MQKRKVSCLPDTRLFPNGLLVGRPGPERLPALPRASLIALSTLFSWSSAMGERVTVEFEAEASTVTGKPFGMVVPRLTIVRGHFTYETDTADLRPADAMRGEFVLAGTWGFRAEFLGRVITGSETATSSTNMFGSPTLSFEDGRNNTLPQLMSIDRVPDASIGLNFRISGQAKDLPTDQLPVRFSFNPPPNGAPHTFVLSSDTGMTDTTGSMLLQFRSFRQVPLVLRSISRTGDVVEIVWFSVRGKRYGLEFSTNLVTWESLRNDLVGNAPTTAVLDDLQQRFPNGPKPVAGFYQLVDRGSR